MTKIIKDVGLGILCWQSYDTLRHMLESYKQQGFLDLFTEKVIYFQEIDDEAKAIAKQYGLACFGNDKNKGIFEGFKGLTSHLRSPIILYVENDQPLIVDGTTAKTNIANAANHLACGEVDLVHFFRRGRANDGFSNRIKNMLYRYFPPKDAPMFTRLVGWFHQTFRAKAIARVAGSSCEVVSRPQDYFAEVRHDEKTDFFIMPNRCKNWVTQNFMVRKEFFENVVIARIDSLDLKKLPERSIVNGFKSIERGLRYKRWWYKQNYKLGMGPTTFTHYRIGDRGY